MKTIVTLPFTDVRAGAVLGSELRDRNGTRLLAAGTELTAALLQMLNRHKLSVLPVLQEVNLTPADLEAKRQHISEFLTYRFRGVTDHACMLRFRGLLLEHFLHDSSRSINIYSHPLPEQNLKPHQEPRINPPAKLINLDDLDQEVRQLPSLSETVAEIVQLIDDGETELSLLMESFHKDQALASRVLKLANSAFYGFSTKISSLKHAGIILGINTLRNIVIQADLLDRYPPDGAGHYDRLAFWAHATGTGTAARVLSRFCAIEPEVAFTAGLLHDLGKLVLDAHFPGIFLQILSRRDREDCSLRQAEELVLGFDHTVVGAKAAEHWKLPAEVQAAILYHHQPGRKGASTLALLIHVADIVCRGLEIGDGGDSLIPVFNTGTLDKLGLNWRTLRESLMEIETANNGTNLNY